MLLKTSVIVGSLVAGAMANPLAQVLGRNGNFCGAPVVTEEQRRADREIMALAGESLVAAADVVVPTYFHVIAQSKTESGGYLSRDTLNKQLTQLNKDFQGTGFSFELKDIDWTVNSSWYQDKDEMGMKRKLRKGSYGALNLYFQNSFEGGYCYYPVNAQQGSEDFYRDGCYISKKTVPGGGSTTFSRGKVASHEVGHWMNLIHTFEGGCDEGDEVDDTPAEAQKGGASGCPEGADTCPNDPGLDPIHNHMTYTADTCRTEFTPGQISRMKTAWSAYRQGK